MTYSIQIDDKAVEPRMWCLEGTPGNPAPGDVAFTSDFALVLDEPADMVCRTAGEFRERLELRTSAGWITVAVNVGRKYIDSDVEDLDDAGEDEDDDGVYCNPLKELTDAELHALRGVVVQDWDPSIEAYLACLDLPRCVLEVNVQFQDCLPPLPPDTQLLKIDPYGTWKGDLSLLTALQHLRAIELGFGISSLDLSLLRGVSLRVLITSYVALRNPHLLLSFDALCHLEAECTEGLTAAVVAGIDRLENLVKLNLSSPEADLPPECLAALGNLPRLEWLDLSHIATLTGAEFMGRCEALRFLRLSGSSLYDLTSLASHPSLETIVANSSALKALPDSLLPRLRLLECMSTPIDPDEVDRFRQGNPACRVRHRRADVLREELKAADYVRVRSGGTCHRDTASEQTLCEERDPDAIADLLRSFKVDDEHSGGHCMCCGEPTIEFYQEEHLLGEVGLHHGVSARYSSWSGDGMLTSESRFHLTSWLAQHGVRHVAEQDRRARASERAAKEMWRAYREMLPREVLPVDGEEEEDAVTKRILDQVTDPAERACLGFRLLGPGRMSWNQIPNSSLFQTARNLLGDMDETERGTGAVRATRYPEGFEGIARWVFCIGGPASLDDRALEFCLSDVTEYALTHPRAENRHLAIDALEQWRGAFALDALRAVLDGIPAQELEPDEEAQPGGMVTFRGRDTDLPLDEVSDQAHAAFALARCEDRSSLKGIRELQASASGTEAEVLEAAARLLESG